MCPKEQQSSNAWLIESPIAAMLLGSGGVAAEALATLTWPSVTKVIAMKTDAPSVIRIQVIPCWEPPRSSERLFALIVVTPVSHPKGLSRCSDDQC